MFFSECHDARLIAPWATGWFSQWMSHWWWNSTVHELFSYTQPSMPNTRRDRLQVPFFKSSVWPNWESKPVCQRWCWRLLNQLYHLVQGTQIFTEGHISYSAEIRRTDIFRNVIVSRYFEFCLINKFFVNVLFFNYWQNVFGPDEITWRAG